MDLSTYLKQECLSAAEFGRRVNSGRATVTRWLDGSRKPSLAAVREIEKATGGKVTRYDLRPDIYDQVAA